jgi:hypothetical protein
MKMKLCILLTFAAIAASLSMFATTAAKLEKKARLTPHGACAFRPKPR